MESKKRTKSIKGINMSNKTTNEIIKEALTELKERRDWKSQWEVEIWFENKLREVQKLSFEEGIKSEQKGEL